jgi:hypothetical protein
LRAVNVVGRGEGKAEFGVSAIIADWNADGLEENIETVFKS